MESMRLSGTVFLAVTALLIAASPWMVRAQGTGIPAAPSDCRKLLLPEFSEADDDGIRYLRADIDVNGDGETDHIEAEESHGARFGLTSVQIEVGGTKEGFTVEMEDSIIDIARATPVPNRLIDPRNRGALCAIEQVLFGGIADRIDPSLAWLLQSKKRIDWIPGPPVLSGSYVVRVASGQVPFPTNFYEDEETKASDTEQCWVTYLGMTHAYVSALDRNPKVPPYEMARKGNRVLLGTAHGVILTDPERSRHAWIYVSMAGEKLRWPSVVGASIEGNTAVIQLEQWAYDGEGPPRVRVDLDTGVVR